MSSTSLSGRCSSVSGSLPLGFQHYSPINSEDATEIDMEEINKSGTELHEAAATGDLKRVKTLLQHLNETNSEGETALHFAAREDQTKVFRHLLEQDDLKIVSSYRNQNALDVALEMGNEEIAMTICDHRRWREFIHKVDGCETQLERMIIKMPAVAQSFLDRCDCEPDQDQTDGGRVFRNFDFVLIQGSPNIEDIDDPLECYRAVQTMVRQKDVKLLTHPVCNALMRHKWSQVGCWVFIFNVLFYLIFLACLTAASMLYHDLSKQNDQHVFGLKVVVVVTSCAQLLKELFQMWDEKWRYFTRFTNLMEWTLYVVSIFCMVHSVTVKSSEFPNKGLLAFAVFLAWVIMVLYLRRSSTLGIYIIMMVTIIQTVLKILILFLPFVLAFGISFFILLSEKSCLTTPPVGSSTLASCDSSKQYLFGDMGYSLLTTFMMLLGEMKYPHTMIKYQPLPVAGITYIIYLLFVIFMPIIIKNLLFGLSVGDVKRVMESAKLEHLSAQVDLMLEVEKILPKFARKYLWRSRYQEPVKKSIRKRITAFGSPYASKKPSVGRPLNAAAEIRKLEQQVHKLHEANEKHEEMLHTVLGLLQEMKEETARNRSTDL